MINDFTETNLQYFNQAYRKLITGVDELKKKLIGFTIIYSKYKRLPTSYQAKIKKQLKTLQKI